MRKEYSAPEELGFDKPPLETFAEWFEAAKASPIVEPNAMALATVAKSGIPSVRMLLMKSFSEQGFVFFSSYESRKAEELAANPAAAAVFYWDQIERQVRIVGTVAKTDPAWSDEYFAGRPRGAQIAAAVSKQSKVLSSRAHLVREYLEFDAAHRDQTIARPPLWGGYCLTPVEIEFWRGAPDRLHIRMRYTRTSSGEWTGSELSP